MNLLLCRAILRALLKTPGRILCVVVLVAVAISVYAGTFMGLSHIENTTLALYQDLRLFDLELRVEPTALDGVPPVEKLRSKVPAIRYGTWRLLAPGTLELPGAKGEQAGAAVMAVPPQERPAVGDVLLTRGAFLAPGHPTEVLIDKTFAEDHGIDVGDSLKLRIQGHAATLTVRGIGVFPEYLMSSILPDYPVPIRGTLAAVLLSEEQVAAALDTPLVNSLVVTLVAGASRNAARDAILSELSASGVKVTATLLPEDQYSVHCTRSRLLSYRDFLPTLILVFNGLAFLVLLLIVRRMAQVWRKELGTLLSYGFHRIELFFSWGAALLLPVTLGGLGGAFGALLLSQNVSQQFLLGTGFPILLPLRSLRPLWEAELLCFGIVFPAVLLPLLPLFLPPPATLLRDESQEEESSFLLAAIRLLGQRIDRLFHLHSPEKLGFRNVFRRPSVFISSTLCVSGMLVAAASMYLFGAALLRGLSQYLSSQRWQYLVELTRPATSVELDAMLSTAGASAWEGLSVVQGQVSADGKTDRARSYFLVAESLRSQLRVPGGLGMVHGRYLESEDAREVVINLRLSQTLSLSVGDRLFVSASPLAPPAPLRIVGVTTNYAINQVFVSRKTLATLLPGPLLFQAAVLTGKKERADAPANSALYRRLSRSEAVARLVPWEAIATSSLKNCDALTAFVQLYGNLSTLVAVLLILVLVQVSVTDRAPEYALLRSLGFSGLDLLRMLLAEIGLLAGTAIVLSLPLTRLATWVFQRRLMQISDFVPLEVSLLAWLKLMAPALLLMLLAAAPAAVRAARIPIALALRTRIGG
jgi:ABC-type lipoprotein release transport system permease subunit